MSKTKIEDLIDNYNNGDKEIPEYVEKLAEDISGGWWNYRVIEKEHTWKNPDTDKTEVEIYYEIHEVYYNAKGEPWAWSENPMSLYFEDYRDLKFTIKSIRKAIKLPVLKMVPDEDIDFKLIKTNKYIKRF